MNNKKIISILMSLAMVIPQYTVFADNGGSSEVPQNTAEGTIVLSENEAKRTEVKQENFDNALKQWQVKDNSGFYSTGKKLILNNKKITKGETYISSNSYQTGNCEFEFDMNIKSGDYFAPAFRMTDDKTMYCLRFYCGSNKIMLLKKVGGGAYVKVSETRYELDYNTDYKVRITLIGTSVTVNLNGSKVMEAKDKSLKSGHIGFIGKNCEASVDNIEIFRYDNVEYEVAEIVEVVKKEAKTIHVSPNGSDEGGDGSEKKPYRTINAAKEAAMTLKKGNTPVNVVFEGGEYPITETINFTPADSGKETSPITYKAKEGEKVIFTGAMKLDASKFEPINDKMKERLYDNVKDKVLQLDLNAQGVPKELVDFTAQLDSVTVGANLKPPILTLNDSRQSIARWPNSGYNTIHECDSGDSISSKGKKENGGVIYYTETIPSRWVNAENLFLEGYFGNYWHGEWAKVDNIDTLNNAINMKYYTQYGISKAHRWAAINLIEELDVPGEWYIDSNTMMLYYYPPHELSSNDKFEIAALKTNMVSIFGAENIVFDGIEFTMTADDISSKVHNITGGNGFYIGDKAKNITVKNCTFSHIGMNGIYISSTDITVDGCVIYDTGINGIYCVNCGDRNTLTPSNVVIQNCDISDVCRDTNQNAWGGIILDYTTVDVTIKNNSLHRINNSAIRYAGNGHNISYNEIYNDANETSDAGAIYSGRSWVEYGTVIEYNFFHDIGMQRNDGPYIASSVFWDDYESGQEMSHNISFVNNRDKASSIQINAGKDNVVFGNTMVAGKYAMMLSVMHAKNGSIDWPSYSQTTLKMNTAPYSSSAWLARYPKINTLLKRIEDNNGEYKIENVLSDNLIVDSSTERHSKVVVDESEYERNVVIEDDYSIFVDPENLDFRVKKEAKAKYGISDEVLDEDFDINKIGIQGDYKPDKTKIETMTVYPEDRIDELDRNEVELVWTKASLADNYRYVVATDPEYKNIVIEGITKENTVKLPQLLNGVTYYWTVYSRNTSRQYGYETEAVNKGKSFSTNKFDVLNKEKLNDKIELAKKTLSSIQEGEDVGEYKTGTKDALKKKIQEAEKAAVLEQGTQNDIDNAVYGLNNFINSMESYLNNGYTTLNITANSEWYNNNANSEAITSEGSVIINSNGGTETSLVETLSNYNVMCFRTKIAKLEGTWVAYGLRASDKNAAIYNQDSYYILVKPDIFELQKHGVIYATAPNNGKMREGEWYDVQFGAITTENGINMMFKLNNEVIFDYLDKTDPNYKPGMFAIFSSNNTVEIAKSQKVPEGLYVMSDEIIKEINNRPELGLTLTTKSPEYIETGKWNEAGDTARSTKTKGDTAGWNLAAGSAGNAKLYKVSYYHKPTPDGDKNVKVKVQGFTGAYETTIDMSSGEEGYVDLGTFVFMSADYLGKLSVTFEASGGGVVTLSDMKYELVDDKEYKDMLK